MRNLIVAAFAVSLVSAASVASANPLAVQAIAGATSQAVGTGVGIGEGGDGGAGGRGGTGGEATSGGSTSNSKVDGSYALGISQAPTAVSGICGKGNKLAFGALEWTDFSSKCFQFMIAMEAAKRGEWELTNQWVQRAEGTYEAE